MRSLWILKCRSSVTVASLTLFNRVLFIENSIYGPEESASWEKWHWTLRDELSGLTSSFIVVSVGRRAAWGHVEVRELCRSGSIAHTYIRHPCHWRCSAFILSYSIHRNVGCARARVRALDRFQFWYLKMMTLWDSPHCSRIH